MQSQKQDFKPNRLKGLVNPNGGEVHALHYSSGYGDEEESLCGMFTGSLTVKGLKKARITCQSCAEKVDEGEHLSNTQKVVEDVYNPQINNLMFNMEPSSSLQQTDERLEEILEEVNKYIINETNRSKRAQQEPAWVPGPAVMFDGLRNGLHIARECIWGREDYAEMMGWLDEEEQEEEE